MAQEDEKRQAEVPEQEEPELGDISTRHTNNLYTLTRREGVLPKEIVVIPDTLSMYNKAENSIVFDLYEVGSLKDGEINNPFVHGVEIVGPKGEVVRFRSVFDDGAMRPYTICSWADYWH
jgi:hypothetical protein